MEFEEMIPLMIFKEDPFVGTPYYKLTSTRSPMDKNRYACKMLSIWFRDQGMPVDVVEDGNKTWLEVGNENWEVRFSSGFRVQWSELGNDTSMFALVHIHPEDGVRMFLVPPEELEPHVRWVRSGNDRTSTVGWASVRNLPSWLEDRQYIP